MLVRQLADAEAALYFPDVAPRPGKVVARRSLEVGPPLDGDILVGQILPAPAEGWGRWRLLPGDVTAALEELRRYILRFLHHQEELLGDRLKDGTAQWFRALPESCMWHAKAWRFARADAVAKLTRTLELGELPLPSAGLAAVAEAPAAAKRFAQLVEDVSPVQHVAFAQDGELLRLWAVTEQYDMAGNQEVYKRELALYDEFPQVGFDFFVLALAGRSVEAALPSDFRVIWSRAERT